MSRVSNNPLRLGGTPNIISFNITATPIKEAQPWRFFYTLKKLGIPCPKHLFLSPPSHVKNNSKNSSLGACYLLILQKTLPCFPPLYELDRSLRLLIMDAIERIEITVRSRIIHDLTIKHGVFAHSDSKNFHPRFKYEQWFSGVQKEVQRSSDDFITHFKQKYEGYPIVPLWCTTEVMSLGNLSRMYKGLLNEDKKSIAHYFNIHPKRLGDWLHVITYVRNVCAHHSRLWNRSLSIRPENVKDPFWLPPHTPRNDRIFYILLMLRFLMRASGNGADWKLQVENLIEPFSNEKSVLHMMGIPSNWKEHPIWK